MKTANIVALLIAVAVLTFFWLCLSASSIASAQSPTVTPWPGPAATATAAANQQAQAQAQRAQADDTQRRADDARAQADALQRQAAASQAAADAAYSAAAQAASDARAALAAQQASVAGEAIGRAESSISEGKAQLASINQAVTQLRDMLDAQAGTVVSLTLELQQARTDKQTILSAYNATLTQQEQNGKTNALLSIFGGLIMFGFLIYLLAFAVNRLRQRANGVMHDNRAEVIDAEVIGDDAEI